MFEFKYKWKKIIHKTKCEKKKKTTTRASSELHRHWKDHFHENPTFFRIIGVFENEPEFENSNIGNKTTNTYKQSHVCNGYYIISELSDVLLSSYYELSSRLW